MKPTSSVASQKCATQVGQAAKLSGSGAPEPANTIFGRPAARGGLPRLRTTVPHRADTTQARKSVCFRVQSGRFSGSVVSLKLTQSGHNAAQKFTKSF